MEENLEIEFKVLINKEIYQQIYNDHHIDHQYSQTNYYLIHPKLTELKYMLRIRQKQENYELTLKQPQSYGNLETNLKIDKIIKEKIITHDFVTNEIFDLLKPLGLDSTMFKTDCVLTTTRCEIKTTDGLICLDQSLYNGITDYELEYEVFDYHHGKQVFLDFISQYNLKYSRNCPSKVKRLMDSLKDD